MHKVWPVSGIKFEDMSRRYRPVYAKCLDWPVLNLKTPSSGCPFVQSGTSQPRSAWFILNNNKNLNLLFDGKSCTGSFVHLHLHVHTLAFLLPLMSCVVRTWAFACHQVLSQYWVPKEKTGLLLQVWRKTRPEFLQHRRLPVWRQHCQTAPVRNVLQMRQNRAVQAPSQSTLEVFVGNYEVAICLL